MSSIKTTQIDGDVAVGRNVTMGGKAVIAGTVEIGHNLKVKGWLDAPNVKGVNKGVFMSVAKLEEAYPTPQDGWLAAVGTSTPFAAYVGADGEWTATGGTVELTVDIAAYEALLEEIAVNSIVSGFIPCSSVGDLPSEEPDNPTVGFLIGGSLYVWVGEGGDTAGGKYYNCGPLRGQTGATGEKGNPGINLGTDFEAFGALSDLEGKTDAQKQAMVPDGNATNAMLDRTRVDADRHVFNAAGVITGLNGYSLDGEGVIVSNSNGRLWRTVLLMGDVKPGDRLVLKVRNLSSDSNNKTLRMAFFQGTVSQETGTMPLPTAGDSCMEGEFRQYTIAPQTQEMVFDLFTVPAGATHLIMSYAKNVNLTDFNVWIKKVSDVEDRIKEGKARDREIVKSLVPFTATSEAGQTVSLANTVIAFTGEGFRVAAGDSDDQHTWYLTRKLKKGTIFRWKATLNSSINRTRHWFLLTQDPADADHPFGIGTDMGIHLRSECHATAGEQWDFELTIPEDGWLAGYYYSGAVTSNEGGFWLSDMLAEKTVQTGEAVLTLDREIHGTATPSAVLSKLVRHNKNGAMNYWGSPSGWRTAIYDVSSLAGKQVAVDYYVRANYYPCLFVTDYNGIPSSKDDEAWAAVYISAPSWSNTTGKHYRKTLTVPEGAGHLLVVESDSYPQSVVTDSIESRLDALENPGEDESINSLNKDRESIIAQCQNTKVITDNMLRLVHFSDLHGDTVRLKRIVEWCEEHESYIDDIVNTGDTVKDLFSNGNPYGTGSSMIPGVQKILTAIGNHDCASRYYKWNSSTKKCDTLAYDWYARRGASPDGSDTKVYNRFIKPYIRTVEADPETGEPVEVDNWGVTQPEGAEENGYTWYYKDYASQGFRLVVLDSMNYTSGNAGDERADDILFGVQRAWYQSVLEDARQNGLAVVTAYHFVYKARHGIKTNMMPWGTANGSGYGSLSVNGSTTKSSATADYVKAYGNAAGLIITDTQAFIDAGGEFICHLVGHSHGDRLFYVGSVADRMVSTPTRQIAIMVDAACCTSSANHYGSVRVARGRAQDSFNYLCLNKTAKKITIVKIGIDANRYGQHVDWATVYYGGEGNAEQLMQVGNTTYASEEWIEPDHDDDGDPDEPES